MPNAFFRAWGGGLLLAFVVFGSFSASQGETCKLKFMTETPQGNEADAKEYPPTHLLQGAPQSFHHMVQEGKQPSTMAMPQPVEDPKRKMFSDVIKKEPDYILKSPLKGVVQFNGKQFGFAFDAVPEKTAEAKEKENAEGEKKEEPEAKKPKSLPAFNRLYFDFNNNGDLTDDEPVKSEENAVASPRFKESLFSFTLPIDQNSKTIEVPCHFRAIAHQSIQNIPGPDGEMKKLEMSSYNAQFYTTCFREGEIKLGDKTFRVILIDLNNNGRFNDRFEDFNFRPDSCGDIAYFVSTDIESPKFDWFFMAGDTDAAVALYLGSIIGMLEGQYWNLDLTPSGDTMTLAPYTGERGSIEKAGKQFQLVALNKERKSFLAISSNRDGKVSLPSGDWKLVICSMLFEKEKPEGDADKGTVTSLIMGPEEKILKITKDETLELPFETTYKVTLHSTPHAPNTEKSPPLEYRLSLSMTGPSDGQCVDVKVNGKRPPRPTFTITTKDGKEVESGAFEYG